MNVCLVIISDGWSGAETVVHELARHFRDRGQNVSIILNQEILEHYADLKGVRLFNIGAMFSLRSMIKSFMSSGDEMQLSRQSARSLPGWAHLTTLLREELYYRHLHDRLVHTITDNDVDIIHAHLNPAICMASGLRSELNVPFIATLQGTTARGLERPTGIRWLELPSIAWKRRRLAKALNRADRVTAVSRFELDAVEKCGISVWPKSLLIPNGINLSEIQGTPSPTAPLRGEFNLLFAGGARFVKGGDLLMKALPRVKSRMPGIHAYVTGRVPQNHAMRRLVAANHLDGNVTFTGFLATTQYRQLLKAVDALVMPSREEGMPLAILEAMALTKPVVASNTGGIPEMIENGQNGLLVEPEPSRIAEAIVFLYERQDVRQSIVRNGIDYVTRFDWSSISGQYIQLYIDAREALHHPN